MENYYLSRTKYSPAETRKHVATAVLMILDVYIYINTLIPMYLDYIIKFGFNF